MPAQFSILCQDSTLLEAWNIVKSKGAAGGVDGVTIEEFSKEKAAQISLLQEELKSGKWRPQPYLQIAIPKKKDPEEKRLLGMAVVRDKIVQQAIRKIIEPRFERLFLPNSYAYRPGKGALKTIKYLSRECGKKEYQYALRLDVDNFFDEVDHAILQQRMIAIGVEAELVRLILLSVKMRRVRQNSDDGVGFERREHQGAKDLVNSMLNYGYAILYVRVWQALLAARLNPFDSILHVRQDGKPTLVYDLVEVFRSQVVDRMVVTLIQKGQDLAVRDGLLTDKTRQLLVKAIMERLARYEKFQGQEMRMEQIILRQAKLLAKTFEGTDKFKPYVAKW